YTTDLTSTRHERERSAGTIERSRSTSVIDSDTSARLSGKKRAGKEMGISDNENAESEGSELRGRKRRKADQQRDARRKKAARNNLIAVASVHGSPAGSPVPTTPTSIDDRQSLARSVIGYDKSGGNVEPVLAMRFTPFKDMAESKLAQCKVISLWLDK
ncbi:9720_t:CDS:2, partial [Acaulospora colombiana]